ncbi:MAG: chorismate-binding protein [Prevotella sp.]|nr:chorismate-binding protein [Prevotella sp.]
MSGFAVFRLPNETRCTLMMQPSDSLLELPSCAELGGRSGFVMAPFVPTPDEPVLLLQPDVVESCSLESLKEWDNELLPMVHYPTLAVSQHRDRADYHIDFSNFHAQLVAGDYQKLVLSRMVDASRIDSVSPLDLFRDACERYPRMFVGLFSTPQSGAWLTATPEVLLSGSGRQWLTIALAGTMPYEPRPQWSPKNIAEQRFVASYLMETLEQFATDIDETGPYTARAAHLIHLRSDFRFTLDRPHVVGDLLQALHPTPAVSGLPKRSAIDFILHNEQHRRHYYSGFCGPLSVQGQTHLFVSLRCMQFGADRYRLYAGGGLLPDSREEQEWQETETKLDTMRNLICTATKKTSTY